MKGLMDLLFGLKGLWPHNVAYISWWAIKCCQALEISNSLDGEQIEAITELSHNLKAMLEAISYVNERPLMTKTIAEGLIVLPILLLGLDKGDINSQTALIRTWTNAMDVLIQAYAKQDPNINLIIEQQIGSVNEIQKYLGRISSECRRIHMAMLANTPTIWPTHS